MAEPSNTELVHRNICRTYDEAIAECCSKEADLIAWNEFADHLVALIWPSESERPECDELGGYTHQQLLEGVRALKEKP